MSYTQAPPPTATMVTPASMRGNSGSGSGFGKAVPQTSIGPGSGIAREAPAPYTFQPPPPQQPTRKVEPPSSIQGQGSTIAREADLNAGAPAYNYQPPPSYGQPQQPMYAAPMGQQPLYEQPYGQPAPGQPYAAYPQPIYGAPPPGQPYAAPPSYQPPPMQPQGTTVVVVQQEKSATPSTTHGPGEAPCPNCSTISPIVMKMKRKPVAGGIGLTALGAVAVPFFWWTGVPFVAIGAGVGMVAGTKKKRYLYCKGCNAVYNLHTKRAHTLKKKPSASTIVAQ